MPKKNHRGQRQEATKFETTGDDNIDDFDAMLAEIRAVDIPVPAGSNSSSSNATLTTSASRPSSTKNLKLPLREIDAACKRGDLPQFRKWRRQGLSLGGRSLCAAAACGNLYMVRCFVQEFGADVNEQSEDGFTPFYILAQQGNLAGLRCVVDELGADIRQATRRGRSPFHTACFHGRLDVIRFMVKELSVDVNAADQDGSTALMQASCGKHFHVVRWLVKEGADPQKYPSYQDGIFPLSPSPAALSEHNGASSEQTAYLKAKMHCSSPGCSGAGKQKCQGCFQARYCGAQCQLAHWKAHKGDCKRWSAELAAGTGAGPEKQ
jgi:hypothetical protein